MHHVHSLTGAAPVFIILWVLALVCFILALMPVRPTPVPPAYRINWTVLGFVFCVLTQLVGYLPL